MLLVQVEIKIIKKIKYSSTAENWYVEEISRLSCNILPKYFNSRFVGYIIHSNSYVPFVITQLCYGLDKGKEYARVGNSISYIELISLVIKAALDVLTLAI